jgi:hypothetical protein
VWGPWNDPGGEGVFAVRWILLVVGALMLVVGLIWTLQGLNVLGGSAMTGQTLWAVVGPIVAIAGVVIVGLGVRRGTARR